MVFPAGVPSVSSLMKNKNKPHVISRLTLFSFAIFLALLLFGINANEPQRVLEQAWNICLDCIGIG